MGNLWDSTPAMTNGRVIFISILQETGCENEVDRTDHEK
jgi:hypothetical protein